MYKVLLSVILSSVMTTAAFAKPASINLTGGTIAPGATLNIPLTQLKTNLIYNVQCTVTDKNFDTNPVILVISGHAAPGSITSSVESAYMNGNFIGGGNSLQVQLPAAKTLLEIKPTYSARTDSFNFYNTDDTDSIELSNCTANIIVD